MMKKFSLSTQLLVLVLTILLSTSIVFIIITYFSLQKIASDQAIIRISSEGTFKDMDIFYFEKDKNGNVYPVISYIEVGENKEIAPRQAEDFITIEEVEELMKEWQKEGTDNPGQGDMKDKGHQNARFYKTKSGSFIYYVINQRGNIASFKFTDNSYVNEFVRAVALRMFTTFLAILFVAVMVIYYWSTRVTRRLKNIQNHIIDLPKDKYEKEYVDDALDEIGELSRSVEDMRKEIGYNENTKQEMLQNVSHDFKTPIAVIKSYAEAYQDGMAGPEALDTIIEQAEVLKKKVNRLLQYNSLEYLTKDKPFEDVNMTELVTRVASNYRFQTKKDIILDLEENVIFSGYHENWSTVIENILDNAKRYAKKEIRITLRKDYLKIFNDGENIEEQFLNSIFKPYEKGSKGQFGLGMSIVKKTVDFFGMNMSVRNESPTGVSFLIKRNDNVE